MITRTPWCFQSWFSLIALPSKLLRLALRRPPEQQSVFGQRDQDVQHQRERRQHEDAREHGVDVERALGLEDQIADARAEPRYSPTTAPTKAMPTDVCRLENTHAIAEGR